MQGRIRIDTSELGVLKPEDHEILPGEGLFCQPFPNLPIGPMQQT